MFKTILSIVFVALFAYMAYIDLTDHSTNRKLECLLYVFYLTACLWMVWQL